MAISDLKRLVVPGALVIGGVTAGSMLAPVALAAAQDDAADSSDQTSDSEESDRDSEASDGESRRGRHGHHVHLGRQIAIGTVTDALDITADELRSGFEDGKSLAEIAAEQGMAADQLATILTEAAQVHIDRAVADERIDTERAAELAEGLSERIDEMINRTPGEGGPGRHGDGKRGHRGERAEAVAEFLGLSVDDLRSAFEEGQTLAEIAAAEGVSEDDLVAFLVGTVEERLDQAVADGRIDGDDAEEKLADAAERISERIHADPDDRPESPKHGHRHGLRGDRPDDAEIDGGDVDTDGETVDSSLDI